MTTKDYIETFFAAFAAIVMASIGIQYTEGFGRAIFVVLTFVLCVSIAFAINCFIEDVEKKRQSNTNKGEG